MKVSPCFSDIQLLHLLPGFFYQRRLVTRAMRQPMSQIAFLYRDRDQPKLLEHFTEGLNGVVAFTVIG